MLKAIIIDDEQQARIALQQELKFNCPQVKIVAEAHSVRSGIRSITEHKPDLVFLDIQLSDGIGFDILENVNDISFKVIFTTAYSDYALKAIKFSALDYLLKPIDGRELKIAVEKIAERPQENFNQQVRNFINNQQLSNPKKRIALSTSEGIHLYELQQIIRCASEGNYTNIYFTNGKRLLVAKTLKELEELLCQYNFSRIHKSHIINIDHLVSYLNKDNGYVVMSDKSTIAVAQRKKSQ
ncbi:MAG: LytTR family DNA-binding domain-containing protein, partial [Bacteroidota bacterium]